MSSSTTPRLGGMMFLEYAVWGAWMPILSATMFNRHFAPAEIGAVFMALWLGCMLTPFIGGQLVDRLIPSQVFLGVTHLLAAGAAWMMSLQTHAHGLVIWMLVWALLFAPSLGITNSITFFHIDRIEMPEAERERLFSWIRTLGTVGWVAASGILTLILFLFHPHDPDAVHGAFPELQLTAVLGVIMAIYSFTLPNTPPAIGARQDPLAFRRAFRLFKVVPGFTVFMVISFFAATEFMFFYNLSGPFLEQLIAHKLIPITKAISQVAEVLALAILLPLWLPKKGMRWCLLVGSFAWPLRYLIFAMGQPTWLVIASLALHGFGYAFVLVVQQLYVDRVAPRDIRASAQSLLTFVTLGLGNVLGSYFSGQVQGHFTTKTAAGVTVTHWAPIFILPAATTLICAFLYMATFRNPVSHAEDDANLQPAVA